MRAPLRALAALAALGAAALCPAAPAAGGGTWCDGAVEAACPVGFFCAGAGAREACAPATACPVAGLAAQPACFWKATTLAGSGTALFADGSGTAAAFSYPRQIAIDGKGDFIVADVSNHRVRRVSPLGAVTTVAGSGAAAWADGPAANASFKNPEGVVVLTESQSIAVADSGNNQIRVISATGFVTTLAGSGAIGSTDGNGTAAAFHTPNGIAQWSNGDLAVSDRDNLFIRVVTLLGAVTTLAGGGSSLADGSGTSVRLNLVGGFVIDSNDRAVFPEVGGNRIRIVTRAGAVTTLAGSGVQGFADGRGTNAAFYFPRSVALDGKGNVVVSDSGNNRIRLVTPAGDVTTLAGSASGYADGYGTAASFSPFGVAVTALGVIVVCESSGSRLRLLTCSPCPASYYCASGAPVLCPAAAFCPFASVNATPCPAGTFSAATGAASNATCAPCPPFSFCPLNSTAPSPCPCPDACAAAGLAAAPSCSPSPTPSPSPSGTPLPSPTPSGTPSPSPSPTASATASVTATSSPPPYSCLLRSEGCSFPSLALGAPSLLGAPPPPPGRVAAVAAVAWPAATATLTVTLPVSPSPGEFVNVTCAPSSPAFIVLAAPDSGLATCAAARGASCLRADASSPAPVTASFLVAAAAPSSLTPGAAATPGSLTCTVTSSHETAVRPPVLPHYGASTTLPLVPARALAASWPLVASVLTESAATGDFAVVAGAGAGRTLPPPRGGAAAFAGAAGCARLREWASVALPACAPALAAVRAIADAATADASAPSFTVFLSGATHVLLAAPPRGPPLPLNLTATLGGERCAVNWVAPDGAVASLTTPSLEALCRALAAPAGAEDCGTTLLVLADAAAANAFSILAAAAAGDVAPSTLQLPAAYPPALAGADWAAALAAAATFNASAALPPASPFGALAALAGGDTVALAAAAVAAAPAGVRAVLACTDPAFAPAAACAAAAASYAPTALFCAWGTGDACQRCPAGAACPGGDVLLPLPGFWAPITTSPPQDLLACPLTAAAERCPGHLTSTAATTTTIRCGAGYAGTACAACGRGFFAAAGSCAACPVLTGGFVAAIARPFAIFGGSLAVFGLALAAAAAFVSRMPLADVVASVGALLIFTWTAAQSAAASMRLTQGLAPPAVAPLYSVFSSLQFAGVAVAPVCLDAPSYLAVWAAVAAVGAVVVVGGLALAVVVRAKARAAPSPAANAAPARTWAEVVLAGAAFALVIGFGALVATLASVLTCTDARPLTVRAYLALENDGATLAAALADATSAVATALAASAGALAAAATATPSAIADFVRAAVDPPFATERGLRVALDAPLAVRLVASNTFAVCYEGPHKPAWAGAAGVAAALAVLLAASGAAAVYAARRAASGGAGGAPRPLAGAIGGEPAAPTSASSAAAAALAAALTPADMRASAAPFVPAQLALGALSTALASLAAAEDDAPRLAGYLGGAIAAQAMFAAATLRAAPFEGTSAWKNGATAALLAIPIVSSGVTLALAAALRAGREPHPAIAILPLAVALPVAAATLILWCRAVLLDATRARLAALVAARAAARAAAAQEARAAADAARAEQTAAALNAALAALRARAPPRAWRRVASGDKVWWVDEGGNAAWVIPEGDIEAPPEPEPEPEPEAESEPASEGDVALDAAGDAAATDDAAAAPDDSGLPPRPAVHPAVSKYVGAYDRGAWAATPEAERAKVAGRQRDALLAAARDRHAEYRAKAFGLLQHRTL